jgi:hypothetical protein
MTYGIANKHGAGDVVVKIKHKHISYEQMGHMWRISKKGACLMA